MAPLPQGGDDVDVLREIAAGQVAPAYLVHGPDRVRHEEVLGALRQRLLAPVLGVLDETVVEGEPTAVSAVVEAASVPSFGGGRRLVVVRADPLFRADAEAAQAQAELAAFLEHPPPSACVLLLTEHEVPASNRLLAAVRKAGRVVSARRPGPRELAAWLQAEAKARGKVLPPVLADFLVQRCQSERLLLRNELEKLCAYAGDRRELAREDVLAVVGKSREERVFDLVDAVLAGRAGQATDLLRDLLRQGESPLGILALLARQYRLIWQARRARNPGELARMLSLHPYAAEKAWRQARVLGEGELAAALQAILEAEKAIRKGALPPEVALELACVVLAVRRPGRAPGPERGATSAGPRRWGG